MRMDPETLLGLIIGLTVANGAVLDLCITEPRADAIPQDLKAIIMVVLLVDVVILLLALFMLFKFPKRGSGTIIYK